jgi:hypothetical protein
MTIAHTVQMYLAQHQTSFDVLEHRHAASSLRTARTAHIHAGSLAKAVMLEDDLKRSHFIMAVVPANRQVDLARLSRQAGRPVHLASEEDAAGLFGDCDAGRGDHSEVRTRVGRALAAPDGAPGTAVWFERRRTHRPIPPQAHHGRLAEPACRHGRPRRQCRPRTRRMH